MVAHDPSAGRPPAPAGWYPDPDTAGSQRYWDGARWTDQSAPAPPPGYGQPPDPALQAAWAASAESSARQWAMIAHLSALTAFVIGLSWVGPLVVYLVKKDEHPFVREHAREALNFNISYFIYAVVGGAITFVLVFVLVGFLLIPVLIALGVAWLILLIVAAVKANNGEHYRYPLTIRMVS